MLISTSSRITSWTTRALIIAIQRSGHSTLCPPQICRLPMRPLGLRVFRDWPALVVTLNYLTRWLRLLAGSNGVAQLQRPRERIRKFQLVRSRYLASSAKFRLNQGSTSSRWEERFRGTASPCLTVIYVTLTLTQEMPDLRHTDGLCRPLRRTVVSMTVFQNPFVAT